MKAVGFALALVLAALPAAAQSISNLESGRPIRMEDATPIDPGMFSGSVDYGYARRLDEVDYAGPAFSLVGGVVPGLELGAESRLLTNPRLNARRGIGSGDLDVHVLGAVHAESENMPGIALRADVILPTGFASHGTNLAAEAIMTRSFAGWRLHGAVGSTYFGSTRPGQRRNQVFAVVGIDSPPGGSWSTDTLGMVDVVVRQSVLTGGKVSVGAELGVRRRIGMQTFFYAGINSELAGERDRIRYGGLLGLTHVF